MTLIRWCMAVAPAVALLSSCHDASGPAAPAPIDSLPRQLSVGEAKLITSSNAFAFDLLAAVNSADRAGNVFISPLSASMALGMTMNGAAGSTYDAMHSTLRFGDLARADVNESYKSLIALLRGIDNTTKFAIANSIWYDQSWPFRQEFLSESQSYFDAEVKGLDLKKPSSADVINDWVSKATSKKIPTIIDDFEGDEVMFLINAIYFKGIWQNQFDKSKTTSAPFHALDGTTPSVQLMSQTGQFRHGMSVAFDGINADFSRMSSSSTPLVISDVIQKTFVDVDEEGTEAAAATSVGVVPTSAPQLIRVDRPFIFAIRERLSGSILFIGKITKLPA